ncbi:MAG: SUMF1/EgtB/PvdO family nonheme iron enzyme [Rhodoferax sp.]|nr:SUMF1/EgtB/PvdO family nonheme iron enzyme [Rhodoferax sp.]
MVALLFSTPRRRWLSMAMLALLTLAAWLVWSAQRTELSRARERLVCALPPVPPDAPHPGMVWVPGGTLALGDTVYPEEMPIRPLSVAGFWLDRTEVTNDQFAAFVNATGYRTVAERAVDPRQHPELPPEMRLPGAVVFISPTQLSGQGSATHWWRYVAGADWRHPGGPATSIDGRGAFAVVNVTIEDAQAYARWKGAVVPSEAQWEWAARAAQNPSVPSHAQPPQANTWQGLFPVSNSAADGFVGLAPVGCFDPNALGLFDMIGNAWELTRDAYTPSHAVLASDAMADPSPASVRPAGGAIGQHVIKGGSFLCAPNYCMRYRAGARQAQDDDLAVSHVGFRTARIAPGPTGPATSPGSGQ